MQRIVESWRVLPAGGLLCRVALCSLGRKVMTHNQFDQSDVIMLTININKSGFAIDTGLWDPSLFCIVTDQISVSFISSNHSEDCGMGSSCFRPSQGCNPAKGVCWHLKRRWFHRFVFLACYEVVTHFIERYLFTTHNCGILWTHSHSPYFSAAWHCMAISIVFGQVWHIVRVETIHSAKWALQALWTGVKLSLAPLQFATQFMPRTFSRSWDLSNVASLRSRAHPLDCCTCTSYCCLFPLSSSMSIFIDVRSCGLLSQDPYLCWTTLPLCPRGFPEFEGYQRPTLKEPLN